MTLTEENFMTNSATAMIFAEKAMDADAGTGTRRKDKPRPKDLSAQLRYERPLDKVDKGWLRQMAVKYKKSYAEFILLYLENDFSRYLFADWRDAEAILRNLINEVDEYVEANDLCIRINNIFREYDLIMTRSVAPIPDPIRLTLFVQEVVSYALSVPGYRARLEKECRTTLEPVLHAAVIDRLLPKTAKLVLQRASLLVPQIGFSSLKRCEQARSAAAL